MFNVLQYDNKQLNKKEAFFYITVFERVDTFAYLAVRGVWGGVIFKEVCP